MKVPSFDEEMQPKRVLAVTCVLKKVQLLMVEYSPPYWYPAMPPNERLLAKDCAKSNLAPTVQPVMTPLSGVDPSKPPFFAAMPPQ